MKTLSLPFFIDEIPKRDRLNVKCLIGQFDAKVTIQNSNVGWRYVVVMP